MHYQFEAKIFPESFMNRVAVKILAQNMSTDAIKGR